VTIVNKEYSTMKWTWSHIFQSCIFHPFLWSYIFQSNIFRSCISSPTFCPPLWSLIFQYCQSIFDQFWSLIFTVLHFQPTHNKEVIRRKSNCQSCYNITCCNTPLHVTDYMLYYMLCYVTCCYYMYIMCVDGCMFGYICTAFCSKIDSWKKETS